MNLLHRNSYPCKTELWPMKLVCPVYLVGSFKAHVCIWGVRMRMPGHICGGQGSTSSVSSCLPPVWDRAFDCFLQAGDSWALSLPYGRACVVRDARQPRCPAFRGSGDVNTEAQTRTANASTQSHLPILLLLFYQYIYQIRSYCCTVLNFTGCFFWIY